MHTKRRPWRPQLTRAEMGRGWVFFALYLTVFPLSMGWVQRAFHGELPVAEPKRAPPPPPPCFFWCLGGSCGTGLTCCWTGCRKTCSPSAPGSSGRGVLHLLVMLIPLPVQNPNPESYAQQFALSPAATVG